MRRLGLLFVFLTLAAPVTALADGSPPPAAVTVCQNEYRQLGPDAFKAKYGATEPYQACLAAYGATTAQPPGAADVCKAEYLQLGPDGFKAKYGATEPYAACLTAHSGTAPAPSTAGGDPPKSVAQMLCKAEGKALGKDSFVAKYGKEALGQCVKAALAKAHALASACAARNAPSKDAFKACVAAAVAGAQPKPR